MRILAIDPAIRNTGFAVIEGDFREPRVLCYGTLSLPRQLKQSECMARINEQVRQLIQEWQPEELAIEGIIYVQSHSTAIAMGAARAASIIAAAQAGLKIMEYPPSCAKLACVGKGQAKKEQVAFMVRALMQLRETPEPDAADALAIGYAHLVACDPLRSHLFKDRKYI